MGTNRGKKGAEHQPALDRERLGYFCARLLAMTGRPVDSRGVAWVACSAPRGPEESLRGSYSCRRCAALLGEAERGARGAASFGRFLEVFGFFFREVASWTPDRRRAAEDGLAETMEGEREWAA